jgi:hypothetical protein
MLQLRLHRQGRQRHGEGKGDVIAERVRTLCAAIGRMGAIDPDGRFHQATEFIGVRPIV